VDAVGWLKENTTTVDNWKGPYMHEAEQLDPWGNPYYVTVEEFGDADDDVGTADVEVAIYGVCAGANGAIDIADRLQPAATFDTGLVPSPGTDDDIVIRLK
jgi:hypothetical protein